MSVVIRAGISFQMRTCLNSRMTDATTDAIDQLAEIIRHTAGKLPEIGGLEETFKWGQRSFLPKKNRIGTTVRIDQHGDDQVAMYVHCQTTLVDSYRAMYPELTYEGKRAIVFNTKKKLPRDKISVLVEEALLYHFNKKKRA